MTGASGFIGRLVGARLRATGATVVPLVRRQPRRGSDEVRWDPEAGTIDADRLEGLAGVVHLAGEPLDQRWTRAARKKIHDSREEGTRVLATALAGLARPPPVLVCASAVGFYGDRGANLLTERNAAGSGFLASVCQAWEKAAQPARDAGIRTVHLRQGLVLGADGGVLPRLAQAVGMGLGGTMGDGDQYWSWIAAPDLVEVYLRALEGSTLAGPVNAVAPQAVPNRLFVRTLADVLHRPMAFRIPKLALRLVFGRMAEETILYSQRVVPGALKRDGFAYEFPDLQGALQAALGRAAPQHAIALPPIAKSPAQP